jgi:hypothetical protein
MSSEELTTVERQARDAARAAITAVIEEHRGHFGPKPEAIDADETPYQNGWVLVVHWQNLGDETGWTIGDHSAGMPFPMVVGLTEAARINLRD